jgi:hypothetical protein
MVRKWFGAGENFTANVKQRREERASKSKRLLLEEDMCFIGDYYWLLQGWSKN